MDSDLVRAARLDGHFAQTQFAVERYRGHAAQGRLTRGDHAHALPVHLKIRMQTALKKIYKKREIKVEPLKFNIPPKKKCSVLNQNKPR